MNKLYANLHIVIRNFRRSFLNICLLLFLLLHLSNKADAQCNNGNASGVVTAPSPGNTIQINACAMAGDYATINTVTASTSYTVTSTTGTDLFTIRQGTPGGSIIAFGITPLIWTSTIAGTYYVHINSNASCGTQVTCRTTAIKNNGACTPPTVSVTPAISCGGGISTGPCNPLTASGADSYTWSPFAGLYTDCTHTAPYTGQSVATVYAAPTVYTIYTVTGTITATGCSNTATAVVNYTPPAPLIVPTFANMCLGDPPVKLQVMSSAPATTQFCASNLNIPVPDNNPAGVFSNVNVAGIPVSCIVTGISVTINMQHTKIGDMVFALRAPNGQVINLDYHLSTTGGSGPTSGFINTIISSTGTTALSSGVNPYTGTFKADLQTAGPSGGYGPAGPTGMVPTSVNWASLLAIPLGNWTLGMYDGVASNTGTLNYWCLNLTYTCTPPPPVPVRPAVWSPAVGLYIDPASTVPYVAGTETDIVWARPMPAGVYTYQATVTSYNALGISFTNPAPITIPVGGNASPYPSDLSVFGLPISGVSVRSVTLHGMTHTSSEDVDIILQSPSGQNVILMSDVGATTALSGTTFTFDDLGPAMSTTGINPTGTYKPTNNGTPDNFPAPGPGNITQSAPALSMFTGSFNGVWKLFVLDDDGTANQGTIAGGFTINFDAGVPGCTSPPRSVVVTVNQQTTITTQPVNQNICIGNNAVFSVVAAGSGPFTYQWQVSTGGAGGPYSNIVNGGPYSGVTTAALTINTPPVAMSGLIYRVVINGGATCGGAISLPATLTVNPLPNVVITANPLIITPSTTATIFSTVTPNPAATYTWIHNGSVVPGATADTIVVDINGLGEYKLSVTDINGCTGVSNTIIIADSFALTLFVYPNPTSGKFQVRYHSAVNNVLQRSLMIYNSRGERIITRAFTQTIPYQKIDVDIRANGKGLYWVELVDNNGKRLALNRVVIQ